MELRNIHDLRRELEQCVDAEQALEEVCAHVEDSTLGARAVAPILDFIAEHSEMDLGVRGPLVHLVEALSAQKPSTWYSRLLSRSVRQKPTFHNLWMVSRVLNSNVSQGERRTLMAVLVEVGGRSGLPRPIRKWAKELHHHHADQQTGS